MKINKGIYVVLLWTLLKFMIVAVQIPKIKQNQSMTLPSKCLSPKDENFMKSTVIVDFFAITAFIFNFLMKQFYLP